MLKDAGFSQVESVERLEGQTFCQDPHCEDTLVFPAQARAALHSTKLAGDFKLIIQVQSALEESEPSSSLRRRKPVLSYKSAVILDKTPSN